MPTGPQEGCLLASTNGNACPQGSRLVAGPLRKPSLDSGPERSPLEEATPCANRTGDDQPSRKFSHAKRAMPRTDKLTKTMVSRNRPLLRRLRAESLCSTTNTGEVARSACTVVTKGATEQEHPPVPIEYQRVASMVHHPCQQRRIHRTQSNH